jgi:hypothetical protein
VLQIERGQDLGEASGARGLPARTSR